MVDASGLPVAEKGYAHQSTLWWPGLADEETPELVWPLSIAVYDRMRRQESQVTSVLRAVTAPVQYTQARIDPVGCRDEVVQLVSEDLGLPIKGVETPSPTRTRDRFSWPEHLRLALLMLSHGHSYFEQVYRIVDGQARLRKLGWRPPKTISKFNVADDGGLISIEQHGITGKRDVEIPVRHLVAYVNDREGGNWAGQSLLRPAYKYWLLKDRALRTQAQTIERNGLGIPTYKGGPYPDDMDAGTRKQREDEEVAAGAKLAAAVRAGDNAGMALRHGADLELKGVTGTLPDADKPIRYYDELIARAVLANFLNLGGDNSTGSYALGETFASFFTLSLQTVSQAIADVASQHIVEDLVDINFGVTEPAPRIVFDEIGLSVGAAAIKSLVDAGIIRPDDRLEQFVRTRNGLPAADPDTARVPEQPTSAPPAPPAPAGPPEPQQQPPRRPM